MEQTNFLDRVLLILSTPRKPFGIWKILSLTISLCVSSIKNFQLANLQESQSRPCWAIGIGVLICRCMASPWVNLLHTYIMDVLVPIKFQICKRKCTCLHIINIALIYAGMKTTYSRNISWRGVHYMAEQTWQWHWASCHETVRRGWVLLSRLRNMQANWPRPRSRTWALLGPWGEHVDMILTWQWLVLTNPHRKWLMIW